MSLGRKVATRLIDQMVLLKLQQTDGVAQIILNCLWRLLPFSGHLLFIIELCGLRPRHVILRRLVCQISWLHSGTWPVLKVCGLHGIGGGSLLVQRKWAVSFKLAEISLHGRYSLLGNLGCRSDADTLLTAFALEEALLSSLIWHASLSRHVSCIGKPRVTWKVLSCFLLILLSWHALHLFCLLNLLNRQANVPASANHDVYLVTLFILRLFNFILMLLRW